MAAHRRHDVGPVPVSWLHFLHNGQEQILVEASSAPVLDKGTLWGHFGVFCRGTATCNQECGRIRKQQTEGVALCSRRRMKTAGIDAVGLRDSEALSHRVGAWEGKYRAGG